MSFIITYEDGSKSICHFGIQGQKWGFRRFQNEDGSLTPLGKSRYYKSKKYSKNNISGETHDRVKDVENDELEKIIKRLELEKRYAELTKVPETKSGIDKVAQLLNTYGNMATSASKIAKFAVDLGEAKYKLKTNDYSSKKKKGD